MVRINADLSQPGFETALPPRIDAVLALAQSRHYREFPGWVNDVFEVNVRSLLRLFEWARQAGVSRFVYTSSANVYALADRPIREDAPLAPGTFYARSKVMGEMLAESYSAFFPCQVFRLFTVYGPGQTGALIPQLVEHVRDRVPVRVEGERGLKLGPLHVSDLCRVFEVCLEAKTPAAPFGLFNVGRVRDARHQRPGRRNWEGPRPRRAVRVSARPRAGRLGRRRRRSCGKAINWRTFLPFAEGIRRDLHAVAA